VLSCSGITAWAATARTRVTERPAPQPLRFHGGRTQAPWRGFPRAASSLPWVEFSFQRARIQAVAHFDCSAPNDRSGITLIDVRLRSKNLGAPMLARPGWTRPYVLHATPPPSDRWAPGRPPV